MAPRIQHINDAIRSGWSGGTAKQIASGIEDQSVRGCAIGRNEGVQNREITAGFTLNTAPLSLLKDPLLPVP